MIRPILFLLSVVFLSACANAPDMKAMWPSTRSDCFVLTEPMSYFGNKKMAIFQSGLFSDTYRAVFEDDDGIYYRGVGEGYWIRFLDANYKPISLVTRAPGGFRMPKKAGGMPSLFMNEDLSGRLPIEYELAQQNHTAAKVASSSVAPTVPRNLTTTAPIDITRNQGSRPIVANAIGSAVGHEIVAGFLASLHGRVVLMDWEGDSAAFWSEIEKKRTICKGS